MFANTPRIGGRWLFVLAVAALMFGACGAATDSSVTTEAPTTTAPPPTTAAPAATTTTEAPTTSTEAPTTTAVLSEEPTPTAPSAFPAEVVDSMGVVTITTRPERIVSLSASSTEMLFAIGAGPQVVAVDSYSYFPEGAPVTDLSAFSPNVEALISFDPDLVIVYYDPGDLLSSLEALGVQALMMGAAGTLDDVWHQIEQLGLATGHSSQSQDLIASMKQRIDQVVSSTPELSLTYYYELDQNLYSVTSATFIGQVLGLLGLENIADPADEQGYGYPQLSSEYIIEVDPDLIFLANTLCCGQNAETVAARPGWSALSAVVNESVVELDDDIASRWGPRIVDLLEVVASAVIELAEKG